MRERREAAFGRCLQALRARQTTHGARRWTSSGSGVLSVGPTRPPSRQRCELTCRVCAPLLDEKPHRLQAALRGADVQRGALVCRGGGRGGGLERSSDTRQQAPAPGALTGQRAAAPRITRPPTRPPAPPHAPTHPPTRTVVAGIRAHARRQQAAQQRQVAIKHGCAQHRGLLH